MFRDPLVLLKYEASRNPIVARLMADIESLSEDQLQIAAANLMPWMRQALLDQKKKLHCTKMTAQMTAMMEEHIVDGKVANLLGETRRWTGDDCFVRLRRGHLEIRFGELMWLDGKGGAWLDTIYCAPFDPVLLTSSTSLGPMTRLQYMDAVRERARGQAMPGDSMLPGFSNANSPLANAGVRFYRPG